MDSFRYSIGCMVFWIVLFLSLTGTPAAAQALEIRVKERVTVQGDEVCLSDIATFSPEDDASVPGLKRTAIASAPPPGDEITFSKHFLEYKIGPTVSGRPHVRLDIPPSVSIRRTAQIIRVAELEDIFKGHVRRHADWPKEKIVFERINTPGDIALPEGRLQWKVWKRGNSDYLGNVFLTLVFSVDERQIRRVSVSGKVCVESEVVKAVRKIGSGEEIAPGDLNLAEERIDGRIPGDVFTQVEEAVGKRALRVIQPGQWITKEMVESPPLVKKGKRVVIKAQNQFMEITTRGKVMEDGRKGDQVKVINISSGKEIFGTVMGPGLVQVFF